VNVGSGSIFIDIQLYRNIDFVTAGKYLKSWNYIPPEFSFISKNRANTTDYTNNEVFSLIINTYLSIRISSPAGSEKKTHFLCNLFHNLAGAERQGSLIKSAGIG
jgi:hypothetical protein